MNNMFTDGVKRVMQLAREESARLGHNYIGTEHLLLGIIKDGKGKAVTVLTNLGLSLETVKQSVEDYVATSGGTMTIGEVPFTPRAKQILEVAANEAKEMKTQFVDVELVGPDAGAERGLDVPRVRGQPCARARVEGGAVVLRGGEATAGVRATAASYSPTGVREHTGSHRGAPCRAGRRRA